MCRTALLINIMFSSSGPIRSNGDRTLYFHSFASVYESWVSTSVIRNSSLFENGAGAPSRAFHVFEGTRSSQAAAQAMTDSGMLLYTLAAENAIGCWNPHLHFRKQNLEIIAKVKSSQIKPNLIAFCRMKTLCAKIAFYVKNINSTIHLLNLY